MPTLEVSKMNPAQMMILVSFADVQDENEVHVQLLRTPYRDMTPPSVRVVSLDDFTAMMQAE